MIRTLRHLLRNSDAAAAVEAAIFLPIYMLLTLGVTDLGSGTFIGMQVNAATQTGAAYAVLKSCVATPCSLPALSTIKTAMNDAVGDSAFCTSKATCTATITSPCVSPCVITVSASYPFPTFLPVAIYSWTHAPMTYSSTSTIRIL